MQPSKTLTIPVCVAGATGIWLVAATLRILSIASDEEGFLSPFSINVVASAVSTIALFYGFASLLKQHRWKVRQIIDAKSDDLLAAIEVKNAELLAAIDQRIADFGLERAAADVETRTAIIEAHGLQMMMVDAKQPNGNVARFPVPKR